MRVTCSKQCENNPVASSECLLASDKLSWAHSQVLVVYPYNKKNQNVRGRATCSRSLRRARWENLGSSLSAAESLFAGTWLGSLRQGFLGNGWVVAECPLFGKNGLGLQAKSSPQWGRPLALLQPPKTPDGRDTWGQL